MFSELMEFQSVVSFSPFLDRKQNFVVVVFFLALASWGVTLQVTLDVHIQMVSLCKGVYPWWWLSERVQNGIDQRIWICDLVQVVWPTLEIFVFIFIILSFESRKFAIQMNKKGDYQIEKWNVLSVKSSIFSHWSYSNPTFKNLKSFLTS